MEVPSTINLFIKNVRIKYIGKAFVSIREYICMLIKYQKDKPTLVLCASEPSLQKSAILWLIIQLWETRSASYQLWPKNNGKKYLSYLLYDILFMHENPNEMKFDEINLMNFNYPISQRQSLH